MNRRAVSRRMPLASPHAQPFFELTTGFSRRAWGMTAKVSALPDSRVAGVAHALLRWEKSARESGINSLKKMAELQAGYGERWNGVGLENTPCPKHQPKNSSLAELPKALTLILLTLGSLPIWISACPEGLPFGGWGVGKRSLTHKKGAEPFDPAPRFSVLRAYHGGQISTPQRLGKMPERFIQADVLCQS